MRVLLSLFYTAPFSIIEGPPLAYRNKHRGGWGCQPVFLEGGRVTSFSRWNNKGWDIRQILEAYCLRCLLNTKSDGVDTPCSIPKASDIPHPLDVIFLPHKRNSQHDLAAATFVLLLWDGGGATPICPKFGKERLFPLELCLPCVFFFNNWLHILYIVWQNDYAGRY